MSSLILIPPVPLDLALIRKFEVSIVDSIQGYEPQANLQLADDRRHCLEWS